MHPITRGIKQGRRGADGMRTSYTMNSLLGACKSSANSLVGGKALTWVHDRMRLVNVSARCINVLTTSASPCRIRT